MTINLPAISEPAVSGRIERHAAEARKDRFMFELERAALGTHDKGVARQHQGAGAAQPGAALHPGSKSVPQQMAQAGALPAHLQGAFATEASLLPAGRVAMLNPAYAGSAATPGLALGGAQQAGGAFAGAESSQASDVPVRPRVAASLLGRAARDAGAAPEEAGAGPGAAAPPANAPSAAYAKTVLHVYHGEQGVHASIRDASLGAAQARAVAAAMAAQLRQAGTSLAGLTVNGQQVMAPPSGAADAPASINPNSAERLADRYDGAAPALQPLTQHAVKGA